MTDVIREEPPQEFQASEGMVEMTYPPEVQENLMDELRTLKEEVDLAAKQKPEAAKYANMGRTLGMTLGLMAGSIYGSLNPDKAGVSLGIGFSLGMSVGGLVGAAVDSVVEKGYQKIQEVVKKHQESFKNRVWNAIPEKIRNSFRTELQEKS